MALRVPSAARTSLEAVPDPATYRPVPGSIPVEPGVYRFRDPHGRVIYVGKAKSLRSRLNVVLRRPVRVGAAHASDGDDGRQRRVDGRHHRSRGAAARVQLDQGVRSAVQHSLPRRQVVSGVGRDPQRGVPAAVRVPGPTPQGGALLRAVLARLGHPRDARPAHPSLPRAHLLRRSLPAAQPDWPTLPVGLHRQVLGAVHRTGERRRAPQDRAGLLRLPGGQDRPAGP